MFGLIDYELNTYGSEIDYRKGYHTISKMYFVLFSFVCLYLLFVVSMSAFRIVFYSPLRHLSPAYLAEFRA